MKAAIYTQYGPPEVVRVAEVEKPVPKENEVLLKVRAAAVNPLDWRIMKGAPYIFRAIFRLSKPTSAQPGRPGRDVAGQVEAVGKNVTRFKAGEEVFGAALGAFAEYACASESALAVKPENVTFEQAASVPVAGLSALQGLRDKGHLQAGQKVLVNGAAGGVGTFAVQIAKAWGAEVTGVCSTKNVELVRSLGANRVIDYTQQDFTKDGERYDVILDCVGNRSLADCKRALNPGGVCVMVGAPKDLGMFLIRAVTAPLLAWFGSRKFTTFMAKARTEDLRVLGELMASGKVRPVIERSYELSEAAEAIRHSEQGHARGKVMIVVDAPGETA